MDSVKPRGRLSGIERRRLIGMSGRTSRRETANTARGTGARLSPVGPAPALFFARAIVGFQIAESVLYSREHVLNKWP